MVSHPISRMMVLAVMLNVMTAWAGAPYGEPWRPQYHFSPRNGWIGDPDGCVRFRGQYHLFWWGHATSTDLVHWVEHPWPMKGDDNSFAYYTGSVVVDRGNTSGFGSGSNPAMVALYTAHDRSGGRERQSISISTNYATFNYYAGNPVLDLNSNAFRDPDVFWDAQTGKWIMLVTLPDERVINIYSSPDLKTWSPLSRFGPVAARDALWEVPVLFPLPLDGNVNLQKWVLICSLGPNTVQYFVGDFDGGRFTLDAQDKAYLKRGKGLDGVVWEDFEGVSTKNWSASGSAFRFGPVHAPAPAPQKACGYLGNGLASSFAGDDEATGTLSSPPFPIAKRCINFLIGGGDHPGETCINLLVRGQVVRTATGRNSESLRWAGWDVSEWMGQEASIDIVDTRPDRWGHIDIDHILFSDTLMNTGREHAHWADWGPDFYAARVFRDYDNTNTPAAWIGWMGNWDYANATPTSWGHGAESIPREIALVSSPQGYELVQTPWHALQGLRGIPVNITPRTLKEGILPLREFKPSRNVYELEAEFKLDRADQHFGLNLCVGGSNHVVVAYDAGTSTITLDRRTSGIVSFSDRFPGQYTAPLPARGNRITFHVFVDQSSVEVFVNKGRVVMTGQVYPQPGSVGLELFSTRGETLLERLTAWELSSIWPAH